MQSAIAQNLADIGAVSLEDYLDGPQLQHPAKATEHTGNAVTRLHHVCQRVFRNTDPLKFEFIDAGFRNKQCILSIVRPDGVRRSYATQPVFARKADAKLEAAKIAIDMGALDFLAGDSQTRQHDPARASPDPLHPMQGQSSTVQESPVDEIERCCVEWRAGYVSPQWIPFFDPKSPQKQGCALRIHLSPHVARIYLSDPTFNTHLDAKGACAKSAVSEGVLDFIKHGNGQTRPSSPVSATSSTSRFPPVTLTTPWTLQGFYDSLPRPFPEHFKTKDASEINPLGWMNTMMQNARGGKLILSFFFTSDGPPGLHGCILKLDRPGEYRSFLVDARFPKRSDAKAAVCLQAMSEHIGNYIRSIISAVENIVTPTMRSFSSGLVFPALTSALSRVDTDLHPHFEYCKERDAFGASMAIRLSVSPAAEQLRQYVVPSDYRSKADAKVAVICHAAEQGVVEFVRFRGGPLPDGYVSPYSLHTYDPDASRKRKQSGSLEDGDQGLPAKKKRKKGKRRTDAASYVVSPFGQYLPIHPSCDQIHGTCGPGDMGLSQSVLTDNSYDPSQPGARGGGGSSATPSMTHGPGMSHHSQTHAASYPAALDPRFRGGGTIVSRGYGPHPLSGTYGGPSRTVDATPSESGPSRAMPESSSRTLHRPAEDAELEPGELVSSAESEFSVSSSRNEDVEVQANVREAGMDVDQRGRGSTDVSSVAGRNNDKGKGKESSPMSTSTTVSRDVSSTTAVVSDSVSSVQNLIDYCTRHGHGTPSFHELQNQGRYLVWIVIGRERYDLPTTYATAEEGRQRVAKQVLVRLSKG